MNVLLIDKGGYFLDFGLRCLAAGHEVRWFLGALKGGHRNPQGDGMGLKKIGDWESSMRWADIILIPDNSVYMEVLEGWWKRGFPIWGPNREIASWEMCREEGLEVLGAAGVKLISSHTFSKLDEAISFVKANPRRFVSKLNDDNDTKAMSYVSKSARDMIFMLEKWKKLGAMKWEFILQEFVPGTEMAVGGWFGPGGFSPWWCENWEHKKLMDGEVGPNTGEMGTVVRYTQDSPLAELLLRPIEGKLHRANYTGYIDVAVIVSKSGQPFPLEFTCRPGWPLHEIQQSLHPTDPVTWMAEALEGRWGAFKPREDIALGVCLCMPDFPYNNIPHVEQCGFPLYGWEKIPRRNISLAQVMMGEAPDENLKPSPCVVSAGENVCTVTGTGGSVSEARERAYDYLKRIELPNSPIYRTDIGCKLEAALPELKRHGLVKGVRYA